MAVAPGRNILWACSTFLWTSTQWRDGEARLGDMLDVIRDVGLDGFRLNGWPQTLKRFGVTESQLEAELSNRSSVIAERNFDIVRLCGAAEALQEQVARVTSERDSLRSVGNSGG